MIHLAEPILRKLKLLESKFSPCVLCPRVCKANRLQNKRGECQVGRYAIVASYGPHYGEEPPLVGHRGSGTVFFSGCNLRCVFCQNYDISQWAIGNEISPNKLADIFISIQEMGCHNLNLVTPTHVVFQIAEALSIAKSKGFNIPVVYNTSGYDSVQALKLLDGLIDIYMPDFKYADAKTAEKYSGIKNYPKVAKKAIKEMHNQVGDLIIRNGVAVRGLLVRHLVLPRGIAGSKKIIDFLVEEISTDTYLNVMDQYYPTYHASDYPELTRRITKQEYWEVVKYAMERGIHRGIPFDLLRHESTWH